ncbi:hypothetical protein ZIOFF_035197 [Zingiber officinale]|uniref:CCHC-type domain-containing protein n=1 Tax=Zingiber officinale TaxID=94328 RepID=A0A8J5G8Z7_ZINOF|nr:hypothetical protein ZIOFF_035197 [Zingiber officinale]
MAAPQLTGHNARTSGGETKKKEASVSACDNLRSVRYRDVENLREMRRYGFTSPLRRSVLAGGFGRRLQLDPHMILKCSTVISVVMRLNSTVRSTGSFDWSLMNWSSNRGSDSKICEELAGSTPRRSAPSTQPVYKQFRELGPTEFKGTTDPIAAEGWIQSLETIFDFMQLTDADKVRCAIFMLRDDSRVWWEGARLIVDLATLTWTNFKEVFYGKYFTVDNRTRLAREFLELRQGDLSVAEYVRRFERGRYFVPMITSQPVEELKHFTEGLRPAIRHDVRLSRVTTFREAVDQALMSERDRNDMIKEAQNKRLSFQGRDQQEPGKKKTIPGQNSGKQPFKQAQPRQQIQKTQAAEGTGFRVENKVRCSKCEKIHAGQCLTGTDACFMCKKSGHFARECPLLREPTKGRVFAMTQEQVDQDTTIITGMIYVANIPAHALIDSGATHSFISEVYLTKLGIIPERMVAGYSVLLPSGEELHSNRMVKNYQMMMQNHMVGARCYGFTSPLRRSVLAGGFGRRLQLDPHMIPKCSTVISVVMRLNSTVRSTGSFDWSPMNWSSSFFVKIRNWFREFCGLGSSLKFLDKFTQYTALLQIVVTGSDSKICEELATHDAYITGEDVSPDTAEGLRTE